MFPGISTKFDYCMVFNASIAAKTGRFDFGSEELKSCLLLNAVAKWRHFFFSANVVMTLGVMLT